MPVRSSYCFCRESRCDFQQSQGGSQLAILNAILFQDTQCSLLALRAADIHIVHYQVSHIRCSCMSEWHLKIEKKKQVFFKTKGMLCQIFSLLVKRHQKKKMQFQLKSPVSQRSARVNKNSYKKPFTFPSYEAYL